MKTTEERDLIDIIDLLRALDSVDPKTRMKMQELIKRMTRYKFIRTKYGMNFYRDKRGIKA